MKKLISITLAMCLIISLCACSKITINIEKDTKQTTQAPTYSSLNKPKNFTDINTDYEGQTLFNDNAKSIVAYFIKNFCEWYDQLVKEANTQGIVSHDTIVWDSTLLDSAIMLCELVRDFPSQTKWADPLLKVIYAYAEFTENNLTQDSVNADKLDIDTMRVNIQNAINKYYKVK